ncbi:MAG: LamG domain-containing protein [Propionibacteriaceae bacterium]
MQEAAAAPGPVKTRTATTVTADGLPTAQINGVVWSQVTSGNTVYAGGEFTSVRPPNGDATPQPVADRSNMMAYDLTTGDYSTTFAPTFNGPVKIVTLSADGKTLYVGGSFTKVNNVDRQNFAAVRVSDGTLTDLAPAVNKPVNAIAVIGQTIYLGGTFNTVTTTVGTTATPYPRIGLAAVNATSGQVMTWAPVPAADPTVEGASWAVQALVATPDKTRIIVGGSFAKIGSTEALGMGSVDAASGAVRPWKANTVVKNYGQSASILSLNVDNDTVYGAGYAYGGGNFEGAFAADPSTGTIKWLQDCHGDTYDVVPIGDKVYTVGHAHFCSNIGGFPEVNPRTSYRAMVATKAATGTVLKNTQIGGSYGNFEGQPAPSLYNWFPEINTGTYTTLTQGAWSVTGNSSYVSVGGEFTLVNNKPQQGLVRMAIPGATPPPPLKVGPGDSDFNLTPHTPKSPASPPVATPGPSGKGMVISWKANWDADDTLLTYEVLRGGGVQKTFTASSVFWKRQTLSFTDLSGHPGQSYAYSIRVTDPAGNKRTSDPVTAVYPSDTTYAQLIKTDGAAHQWRLGSPVGQASDPDAAGQLPLTLGAGVTLGAAGAIAADANTAAGLGGGATAEAHTSATSVAAGPWSLEGWFKSTGASRGAVLGFRSREESVPTLIGDSQVYLNASGQLTLAVHQPGATPVVSATTQKSYNDDAWHQVVAVRTGNSIVLYVDGAQMAVTSVSAASPALTASWTVGGATTTDVPNAPGTAFSGTIDEVSVFGSALTAKQVRNHYLAAKPRTVIATR